MFHDQFTPDPEEVIQVHPALQDNASTGEETASAEPTPAPIEAAPPEKPSHEELQQRNFKELRDRTKQIERERDEAVRQLQALSAPQPEDDYDVKLGNDEIAEGKHLRELAKELKSVKKQFAQYAQETKAVSIETRLKQQYPDIEQVVTEQSINQLREQYPELAATLSASSDDYNKAASAYTLIKKLGIISPDTYNNDKAQAQKNFNKPRPLASIAAQQGDSPLTHANAFANGLTPELKKQLWEQMQQDMKRGQ